MKAYTEDNLKKLPAESDNTVVITITGGVADVQKMPPNVRVCILDYDIEDYNPDSEYIYEDSDNDVCSAAEYLLEDNTIVSDIIKQ